MYVGNQGTSEYNRFWIHTPTDFFKTDNDVVSWFSEKPLIILYDPHEPTIETLPQDMQDKLNYIASYEGENYVYTVLDDVDKSDILLENLKPQLHAKFLPAQWYKENLLVNNLLIWNKPLDSDALLKQYKTYKRRFGL